MVRDQIGRIYAEQKRYDEALTCHREALAGLDATKNRRAAVVTLSSGGSEFAKVTVPNNAMMFAGNGETFDVGRDIGVPVTEYKTPQGAIQGDIPLVRITFD